MELEGKTAILTGAAGGVGEATARLFAKEGAELVLVDIRKRQLDVLTEELAGYGARAAGFAIDVSEESQVRQVVETTAERFGKIDILINNAAVCKMIPILDIGAAEWDRVMAVNLRSVFLFCREVFRRMKERRSGKVVNIGSAAGKIGGLAAGAHYSSSKAAVMCFTKSLALQAAEYRINVNAVCPGPTKTEMTDDWGDETNKDFASKIPFREYGRPEDVAEAILFLCSDRSRYITGEVLDVNGGLVMD